MEQLRATAVDAAMAVIARAGARSLSSSDVDAEAALPVGTTARLFPIDANLLQAVADRVVEVSGALWTRTGNGLAPASIAEFAERAAEHALAFVTDEPVAAQARIELLLAFHQSQAAGQAALYDVLVVLLDALGVPEPEVRARDVGDFVAGVMLHQLTIRAGEAPQREALAAAIGRLLTKR